MPVDPRQQWQTFAWITGRCMICGVKLVYEGDGDNRDCGGDCWGCIREIEEWASEA